MTTQRLICAVLACFCFAVTAFAQSVDPAVLIADRMYIRSDGTLFAEGTVEAHQGNLHITAHRVTYSQSENRLRISGPILLTDSDSGATIHAKQASLDPQLIEGLMLGARLVLDRQLQLAAVELNRTEGRYTQLYKVAATSCRICGDDSPPIWQIRAREVIHDAEERQLYFQDAQFLVFDLPIVAIPQLRMPDPTLDRATGFLVPSGRSSSILGTGIKIPYFIAIGDHRDLTLTPYFSPDTTTLEFEYRQAFVEGDLRTEGAFSSDSLSSDTLRYYVFANGDTKLPLGYQFDYDIEATSDTSYLIDYGYSGKDRLDSAIGITRIAHDLAIEGEFIHYQTLRDTEQNATQPTLLAELSYEKRIPDALLGGALRLNADAHAHYRFSNENVDGRDVSRMNASAHWHRFDALENGVVYDIHGLLDLGASVVAQDDTVDENVFNASPAIYSNFRLPLMKSTEQATYLLEPQVQLAWSASVNEITNEESTRVEFDEGNLLDFSRFPAPDRVEEGVRIAVGTSWSRTTNNGHMSSLSFGRVIRDQSDPDLTKSSGLQGVASDWLVAGQISTPSGFELISRALFDDDADFSKSESRLRWNSKWGDVTATHIWLTEDPEEDREESISEVNLTTNINLSRHWSGQVDWQFDIAAERIVRAGLGLTYENECLDMRLAASRRFTESATVDPSTDYDFRIGLRGFGAGRSGSDIIRTCGS